MKPLTTGEVRKRLERCHIADQHTYNELVVPFLEVHGMVVVDAVDTPNEKQCSYGCDEDVINAACPMHGHPMADIRRHRRIDQETSAGRGGGFSVGASIECDECGDAVTGWWVQKDGRRICGRCLNPPPPFPNAYPGPLVNGQPTWGAYLRDVPDDGYEVRQSEETPWVWPVLWRSDSWVLVRRTPQPATERVPWHEAVGRREPSSGDTIVQVSAWNSGSQGYWLARDGETQYEVSGGTVEVLVDNEETGT